MCTSPLFIKNNLGIVREVPCGDCDECLKKRSDAVYVRLRSEYEYCKQNGGIGFFCMLTYSSELVPTITINRQKYKVFDKKGIINFIKRLRINLDRLYRKLYHTDAPDFKYFVSSEYGTSDDGQHLPHYHLLFFFREPISHRLFKSMYERSIYKGIKGQRYFGYIFGCQPIQPEKGGIRYSAKYVCKDIAYQGTTEHIKKLINQKMKIINKKFGVKTGRELNTIEKLQNACIHSRKDYKKAVEDNIRPLRHMLQFYMLSNDMGASVICEKYKRNLQAYPCINFDGFVYSLPRHVKDMYERIYGYKARKLLDKSIMLNQLKKALEQLTFNNQITTAESDDLMLFARTYIYPMSGQLKIIAPKDIDLFETRISPMRDFQELESEFKFFNDNDFYQLKNRIESVLRILNSPDNLKFRASLAREKRLKEENERLQKKRNKGYIK